MIHPLLDGDHNSIILMLIMVFIIDGHVRGHYHKHFALKQNKAGAGLIVRSLVLHRDDVWLCGSRIASRASKQSPRSTHVKYTHA